jgi:hypothetical protein
MPKTSIIKNNIAAPEPFSALNKETHRLPAVGMTEIGHCTSK